MKKKKTVKAKAKAKKTKLEKQELKSGVGWRMPESKCPWCGIKLNGAYQDGLKKDEAIAPNPGDVTVCIGCCEIIVFGKAYELLKPDYAAYREASKDKGVMMARAAVLSGRLRHEP